MNVRPVLLIFLDGLMPEHAKRLDVLRQLPHQARMVGKYGYSIACHASMYTGLEVSDHKYWFVWQRKESEGLAAGMHWLRNPMLNNVPSRLLAHKLFFSEQKARNTSFFGIPRAVHCRTRDLLDLTVTEWLNYDEPGYIAGQLGFLDKYRAAGRSLDLVGFDKRYREESKTLDEWAPDRRADVTYWFLGDVDHFSHKVGQDREGAAPYFTRLNDIMNRAFDRYVAFYKTEPLVLAWSDHGHAEIKKYFDPYSLHKDVSSVLGNTPHVVDATYLRLWRTSDTDAVWKAKLTTISQRLEPWCDVLDEARQRQLSLWPGDNRFGDVVFALRRGAAFTRTMWGWSRGVLSQHGYDPQESEMDGFVASNSVAFSQERVAINRIHDHALAIAAL